MTPAPTRNPRNPEHTPGGSSSGSAAAVAAGMVPAAVGTQTGGSVIRPAAFCGVYGFKPTFGLIPRHGVLPQAPTLDTIGVFGRSVEDVALVADALQGYDERDPASLATSRPRLLPTATEEFPLAPLLAFVKTSAWGRGGARHPRGFRRAGRGAGLPGAGGQPRPHHRGRPRRRPDGAGRGDGHALRRAARPRAGADQQGPGRAHRAGPAHPRRRLLRRPRLARALLCDGRGGARRLRLHPHARRPRPRAEGPRHHRQSGVLRVLDLDRRARRHPAAAGGRRHADGRAADRSAAATTAASCAPPAGWCGTCRRRAADSGGVHRRS